MVACRIGPEQLDDRLNHAVSRLASPNTALREYAARHRRIEALETYATLSRSCDYEGWERRRQADRESP